MTIERASQTTARRYCTFPIKEQEKNMNIASIILQHLGGHRFVTMTGAKAFGVIADGKGLGFRIPKSKDGISHVEIILNGNDLYDMTFSKAMKTRMKPITTRNDISFDQLQEVFTSATGLDTHL